MSAAVPVEDPTPAGPVADPDIPEDPETPATPTLAPPAEKTEDEKRKDRERKANAEAAQSRVARKKAEQERDEAKMRVAELESKLAEIDAKVKATPQGPTPEQETQVAKLTRDLTELNTRFKKSEEARAKAEDDSRSQQIKAHLSSVISDTEYLATDALKELLAQRIRVSKDGICVMDVEDEGETIEVAVNRDNLKKHKPIPNFEQFLKPSGKPGSGSQPPGSRRLPPDGIDREKCNMDSPLYDQVYYLANLDKITELKRKNQF